MKVAFSHVNKYEFLYVISQISHAVYMQFTCKKNGFSHAKIGYDPKSRGFRMRKTQYLHVYPMCVTPVLHVTKGHFSHVKFGTFTCNLDVNCM